MRRVLLFAIAFMVAACGHETTGPSPTRSSIPGTYNLTMVDGHVLPFVALDLGAYRITIVSGTLVLRSDGTYSFEVGHRTDDSGNVRTGTDTDVGLWNAEDDAISLASTKDVVPRTGVVAGNAITLESNSRVLVLKKDER
jgi:hypothetical protein